MLLDDKAGGGMAIAGGAGITLEAIVKAAKAPAAACFKSNEGFLGVSVKFKQRQPNQGQLRCNVTNGIRN